MERFSCCHLTILKTPLTVHSDGDGPGLGRVDVVVLRHALDLLVVHLSPQSDHIIQENTESSANANQLRKLPKFHEKGAESNQLTDGGEGEIVQGVTVNLLMCDRVSAMYSVYATF
jgi:hypothetical protein